MPMRAGSPSPATTPLRGGPNKALSLQLLCYALFSDHTTAGWARLQSDALRCSLPLAACSLPLAACSLRLLAAGYPVWCRSATPGGGGGELKHAQHCPGEVGSRQQHRWWGHGSNAGYSNTAGYRVASLLLVFWRSLGISNPIHRWLSATMLVTLSNR